MDVLRPNNEGVPNIDQESYTVDELANLLGMSREVVVEAVDRGELSAQHVGPTIGPIRREDALAWLDRRGPGV